MSMQFTAFSIADLWKEGMDEFYIYELTKTNKVVKHKVRDLIEFDDCIIIAIGDDKSFPKHKLVYSSGSGTRRQLGDSVYYTDFAAIKSKFNAKNGEKELREEIVQLEKDIKGLSDVLESKKNKHARLIEGMKAEYLIEMEQDDKDRKDEVGGKLKKTIYCYASRYGTDLSFTFLIDRIWLHIDKTTLGNGMETTKEEFIKSIEDTPNAELEKILKQSIQSQLVK